MLCVASSYGFFFQPSPVAVITAPAVVQVGSAGSVFINGSGSYDPGTDVPIANYTWTITAAGSGEVLNGNLSVVPAAGLSAPTFSVQDLPPGTYNFALQVRGKTAGKRGLSCLHIMQSAGIVAHAHAKQDAHTKMHVHTQPSVPDM